MAEKFKVSFEVQTEDESFTRADVEVEVELFGWSRAIDVKNVKVEKTT